MPGTAIFFTAAEALEGAGKLVWIQIFRLRSRVSRRAPVNDPETPVVWGVCNGVRSFVCLYASTVLSLPRPPLRERVFSRKSRLFYKTTVQTFSAPEELVSF